MTSAAVWEALRTVTDPEYPLSIVDLGMVYGVQVEGNVAQIEITFTSIGCPAIDMIVDDVRDAVMALEDIGDVQVAIVWSPPWTKERITAQGRWVLEVHGVVS